MRRKGNHIISKHYVTLTEALLGCNITVHTVNGQETLKFNKIESSLHQHVLSGRGVQGKGDHIAEVEVMMPRNLDSESTALFEKFAKEESTLNYFDPSVPFY